MGVLPDWMIERDVVVTPKPQPSPKGEISSGLTSYGLDMRLGYKFKVFTNVHCAEIDPKNFDQRAFVDVDVTPKSHDYVLFDNGQPGDGYCVRCNYRMNEEDKDRPCPHGSENYVRIPPNSFALGESLETITIPRDCLGICVGKSTYARCGLVVNTTPLEPDWKGKVTIEISNTTPSPARVYAGEGIMQVIFLRTDGHCEAVMNAVRRLCSRDQLHDNWPSRVAFLEETLHRELGRGTCRTSYADKSGRYQGQTEITLPFVEK